MHVTIIVPVYNEHYWIPWGTDMEYRGHRFTTLVVDDGSDEPWEGTLRHETNRGYGAAIKTGIAHATTEYVLTMDGDGQHELEDAWRLVEFLERFPECDMVIGNRRLTAWPMGVPIAVRDSWSRYLGRKFLNGMASFFAWRWIPDLNSGLRLFKKSIAEGYAPILCDGFSFTTTLTLSMLVDGYTVDWLPIRVKARTDGLSKVKKWKDGCITLYYIVRIGVALRTRTVRMWRRRAARWLNGKAHVCKT